MSITNKMSNYYNMNELQKLGRVASQLYDNNREYTMAATDTHCVLIVALKTNPGKQLNIDIVPMLEPHMIRISASNSDHMNIPISEMCDFITNIEIATNLLQEAHEKKNKKKTEPETVVAPAVVAQENVTQKLASKNTLLQKLLTKSDPVLPIPVVSIPVAPIVETKPEAKSEMAQQMKCETELADLLFQMDAKQMKFIKQIAENRNMLEHIYVEELPQNVQNAIMLIVDIDSKRVMEMLNTYGIE